MSIAETAAAAKDASIQLSAVKTAVKNNALTIIADTLRQRSDHITAVNEVDMEDAKKSQLAEPLLKRLNFDEGKIESV